MGSNPVKAAWSFQGPVSRSPETLRPFSGVTIAFVTQERRAFNSLNYTVIFLFVTLKTY